MRMSKLFPACFLLQSYQQSGFINLKYAASFRIQLPLHKHPLEKQPSWTLLCESACVCPHVRVHIVWYSDMCVCGFADRMDLVYVCVKLSLYKQDF